MECDACCDVMMLPMRYECVMNLQHPGTAEGKAPPCSLRFCLWPAVAAGGDAGCHMCALRSGAVGDVCDLCD